MFKVKVFTIGRWKEAWLKEAVAEYEKRLQGKISFEWILAKDDPHLLQLTEKEPFLILLDPKGKLLNSEEAHQEFMQRSRLFFVIGGPEGLPSAIFARPHFRWSLSPLTFTHQIVRLILVEQLYRSWEIEKGSEYHK